MNPILLSFFSLQPTDRFGKTFVSLTVRKALQSSYDKSVKSAITAAERRLTLLLSDAAKKLRNLSHVSRSRQ